MKILSFESTAKTASVALSSNGRVVSSFTVDAGLTHSEVLLPMAEAVLQQAKCTFDEIDAYAVVCGPGSFTGIRIGVATVKGLAFGKGRPIVALSSTEALAQNMMGIAGLIVPVIDCRRNECYCALFHSDGEDIRRLSEDDQMKIADLAPILSRYEGDTVYLVGDATDKAFDILTSLGVTVKRAPIALRAPSAINLGILAEKKIERGEVQSDASVAPIYLKPAQAERERLEKENNKKEI